MRTRMIRIVASITVLLSYSALATADKSYSEPTVNATKVEEQKLDQSEVASNATKSSAAEASADGPTIHTVDQKNKTFSRSSITVSVGDEIKFTNSDSYFHNIYSLSDTAQFDLGSYPKGESRSIQLEKAGEVLAKCAIHPQMEIAITVEENPSAKLTNAVEETPSTRLANTDEEE